MPAFPMQNEIMIADDDAVSQTRLKAILEGLGYTPRVFDNGWDAWNAFDEQPARIVISDWQMPGLDGVNFCKLIRNRPTTPYTYFILVTAAFTTDDDYTHAIGADVDDFLIKPLRRDAIWRRLHVARRILQFTQHIQQLEQLLPICMYCKRIREGEQNASDATWEPMEKYIHERTGSEFSHGICPECFERASIELGARKTS